VTEPQNDVITDLRAAIAFVRWCADNGRPVQLGLEWLEAIARKARP
jgi:hypothetical protein